MKRNIITGFLAVFLLLSSTLIGAVQAGIPNEDEDDDDGIHESWAWAKIYAEWNPVTERYTSHQHWHDGDVEEGGYYCMLECWNDFGLYYPYSRTKTLYSTDQIYWYYSGADALAQLSPL